MEYNSFIVWLTAVVTVSYQLLFFFIASQNRFDKVTDFAGGSNFAINALLSYFLGASTSEGSSKRIVATVCVLIWASRLSGFLLIRVLKAGEDKRFDEMRENFWKFLGFWIFQMIWVFVVGLPLVLLNASKNATPLGSAHSDSIGLILFIIGFVMETFADQHKFNYRFYYSDQYKLDHPEARTVPVLKTWLWKWSRQPNYFGEILLWWGLFILCLPSTVNTSQDANAYVSVISPLFLTFLLLFLSGIPLSEAGFQKRYLSNIADPDARDDYLQYRESTSPLIPFPPQIYSRLPTWMKRIFFFEWPMYESKALRDLLEGTASDT